MKWKKIASLLCAAVLALSTCPVTALAAGNTVEAKLSDNEILVKGSIPKNTSASGFEVSDQDCDHISAALFDLALMMPISDVTVIEMSSEQKKSSQVNIELRLQIIPGYTVNPNESGRYVLMGSFEKKEGILSEEKTGSQFSGKLIFREELELKNESAAQVVEMNRLGYIAKDKAALKAGPNDDLPAMGKDGLYLELPLNTEVIVVYKGDYTYKVEYDGEYYYTALDNIRFEAVQSKDNLADTIREMMHSQSMLKDFYMYGVSDFNLEDIQKDSDLGTVISLTRDQLMNGAESVEEALKAYLKESKNDGVSADHIVNPFLDAVIEEDPMEAIGQAANDLYSKGRTEAIRERDEALAQTEEGATDEAKETYEEEHAGDAVNLEIDKEVIGELFGQIWDSHLADDIIRAEPDEYGQAITEKIYGEILGWNNRLPKNYGVLKECYTGTPENMTGFDVLGDCNLGNDFVNIQGDISQSEVIRKYGGRMSELFQEQLRSGALKSLPLSYQTANVSSYNRFLPGSLVVFKIWDFRVFSTSEKEYLGVYAGNGEFYLPDFSDAAFDTLCDKLDGIERVDGLIKISVKDGVNPLNKNANYGFLWLCIRNISITNVYEADLSLFNDPKYSKVDDTYFPDMDARRMSQIRYYEVQWQLDNGWRPPKVWKG